jgi:hypothetical protein
MIGCAEARERVALCLSGEIDPDGRRALEELLRACAGCSADTERTRRAIDLFAADDVPDPGPDYWSSFGGRLRARIEAARRRARLKGLAAAIAAAAIIVTGLAVRPAHRGDDPGTGGNLPRVARNGTIGVRPPSVEATEVHLRETLEQAMADGRDLREIETILDEIAPADPLEGAEGLGDLPPEDDGR